MDELAIRRDCSPAQFGTLSHRAVMHFHLPPPANQAVDTSHLFMYAAVNILHLETRQMYIDAATRNYSHISRCICKEKKKLYLFREQLFRLQRCNKRAFSKTRAFSENAFRIHGHCCTIRRGDS